MRLSKLFGKTLREDPADAESDSHRLLIRSGMIAPMTTGIYSLLPMSWRVIRKLEQIIREEMDAVGGQELHLPTLQPSELWEQSGRRTAFGDNLFQLTDRRGRELVMAPTHEEAFTLLAKQTINSYRDLPILIYQIQTKFRDEPRPRGGLLRVREFSMKDLYSFDTDYDKLDVSYQQMVQAYQNIFTRCGIPSIAVEADSGAIGGKDSHEFILLAERGEDTIIHCSACKYAANQERATTFEELTVSNHPEPLSPISTPETKTIEEIAELLDVPKSKIIKTVVYLVHDQITLAMIRGDLAVNEVKLKNLLNANDIRLATDEEVTEAGLIPGFVSAIDLKGFTVVGDKSISNGANFVMGGNKLDTHYQNANYPRDFSVEQLTDIATAEPGHQCPNCHKPLTASRGIEIGHVFKLGTTFSETLGAYYLDSDGTRKPIVMGSYGIGLGRLLAAVIEQNHDEKGIIWPAPIAPFQAHVVVIGAGKAKIIEEAERIYQQLLQNNIETLLDDRDETVGVKFNDADLLGIPVRITVSPRNMESGQIELKLRAHPDTNLVSVSELIPEVAKALKSIALD